LLVVSLPIPYKHFNEILSYSNNEILPFEDVKSNLWPKEKFDLEMCSDDKAQGLSMKCTSSKRGIITGSVT